MKRPRTRLALRLAVCAVIGAVVTVLAAWGIALWLPEPSPARVTSVSEDLRWPLPVPAEFPEMATRWSELGVPGWRKRIFQTTDIHRATLIDCGWPFLSMRSVHFRWWTESSQGMHSRAFEIRRGTSAIVLPSVFLWPAFALDTAFYGTLAFVLWSAPGFVRRTRRCMSGQCIACGYELQGMERCPECGRDA